METQVSNELSTIVKESGIEITKAEGYAISFAPFMQKVNEITAKSKEINYENPTPQDAILARKLRLELVPNRTGSEKKKDELKKGLLTEGNLIQSLHNVVKNTSEMTENALMEVEKFQERREAERKAKVKAEREAELSQYVDNASMFPLGEMSQEAYEQLLNGQILAKQAAIEAEKKAEEARIENERKEKLLRARHLELAPYAQFIDLSELTLETTQEAFAQMKQSAFNIKAEHDAEQERIRIENERLKKEAEEKELALQKERAEAERILTEERQKAEAEAKRIQEENEKKLASERAEKLRVEKELFEKREAERKAKEEADAKAEAEAAKGDKQRYADLIIELEEIAGKYSFRSKKYRDAHGSITEQLNTVINYAISKQ